MSGAIDTRGIHNFDGLPWSKSSRHLEDARHVWGIHAITVAQPWHIPLSRAFQLRLSYKSDRIPGVFRAHYARFWPHRNRASIGLSTRDRGQARSELEVVVIAYFLLRRGGEWRRGNKNDCPSVFPRINTICDYCCCINRSTIPVCGMFRHNAISSDFGRYLNPTECAYLVEVVGYAAEVCGYTTRRGILRESAFGCRINVRCGERSGAGSCEWA